MNATFLLMAGVVLFCSGLFIVLTKRNSIMVLIGIELMLNAANLNFITFAQSDTSVEGNIAALLVMVLAAIEAAVGLAIIFKIYRNFGTVDPSAVQELKD